MEKNKVWNCLLDLLYPPRCVWCHRYLNSVEKRERVCARCKKDLPLLDKEEREQSFPGLDSCTSLLEYDGDVRQSILRYKFQGLSFYSSVYTELMSSVLDADEYACDVITWVPLSRKRLRTRGYDQAKLLAEGFAKNTELPCIPLLKKVRNTAPQSGTRKREERSTNIRDAYQAVNETEMNKKVVLLLDDIVTTGATLSECAGVLKSAGAKQVKALTLARTDLKRVR